MQGAGGDRRLHDPAGLEGEKVPPAQLGVLGERRLSSLQPQPELDGPEGGEIAEGLMDGQLLVQEVESQQRSSPGHGDQDHAGGRLAEHRARAGAEAKTASAQIP
ncbi:MAG: hypothetical protein DMH00_04625 [Acidobacteria bacterium]|nr:MAG: hypothetical protein DMH00_04625 [Acidobacteriota bacterium]